MVDAQEDLVDKVFVDPDCIVGGLVVECVG